MGVLTFKCPGCGGYLEFDPAGQDFSCVYCGRRFTREEVDELASGKARAADYDTHLREYHCKSCGAQIVTDDTTAATRCYYCHGPVVLTDRLEGEFHPDGIIPFSLDREAARKSFAGFMAKHRFVDRRFFNEEQMESFTGVYYPYWMTDIEADGTLDGEGSKTHVMRGFRETVTETDYFQVHREAKLSFRGMVRKALSTVDRQLSDGIHPYDMEAAQPFDMALLSGFLAERRDVEAAVVQADVLKEAQGYVPHLMKKDAPYDHLSGNTALQNVKTKLRYVLLPVWVLTYRAAEPGKTYYFMMNGQNGRTCGRLPVDKKKLGLYAAAAGVLVAGLLALGGAFIW